MIPIKIPIGLLFILLTQKHLQAGADSKFYRLKAHVIQEALFKKNAKSDLKTSICQNEKYNKPKQQGLPLAPGTRLTLPTQGSRFGACRKPGLHMLHPRLSTTKQINIKQNNTTNITNPEKQCDY